MSFWKPEPFGQTKLPGRSILKGQKNVENAKIKNFKNFKCDILSNFQTMWTSMKAGWCHPRIVITTLIRPRWSRPSSLGGQTFNGEDVHFELSPVFYRHHLGHQWCSRSTHRSPIFAYHCRSTSWNSAQSCFGFEGTNSSKITLFENHSKCRILNFGIFHRFLSD